MSPQRESRWRDPLRGERVEFPGRRGNVLVGDLHRPSDTVGPALVLCHGMESTRGGTKQTAIVAFRAEGVDGSALRLLVRHLTVGASAGRGGTEPNPGPRQPARKRRGGPGTITKHAKNPAGATRLLEWLSSEKVQNLYADVNLEHPVNAKVKPDPTVAAWGSFKQNLINVKEAGSLQAKAVKLMDRAGYK